MWHDVMEGIFVFFVLVGLYMFHQNESAKKAHRALCDLAPVSERRIENMVMERLQYERSAKLTAAERGKTDWGGTHRAQLVQGILDDIRDQLSPRDWKLLQRYYKSSIRSVVYRLGVRYDLTFSKFR